jgi:hypothetical protein
MILLLHPALAISDKYSPITNLKYRFAFTDIANAL